MAVTTSRAAPLPVDIHVGARILDRRIALGFNQSKLAHALGVTFQQVQKYEKGTNRVSASKLFDIASFLGVDVPYFFHGLEGGAPDEPGANSGAGVETPVGKQMGHAVRTLAAGRQKLILEVVRALAEG